MSDNFAWDSALSSILAGSNAAAVVADYTNYAVASRGTYQQALYLDAIERIKARFMFAPGTTNIIDATTGSYPGTGPAPATAGATFPTWLKWSLAGGALYALTRGRR